MAKIYQRGKTWYLRYSAGGRDVREAVGPCKRDAERALAARRTQVFEGKFFDKKQRCEVTLKEFRSEYLAQARLRKRSWARDALSLRNLCASDLGSLKLDEITLAEVVRYQDDRLTGRLLFGRQPTHRTINLEVKTLLHVLNVAVDMGVLAENQLRRRINGKLLSEPKGRERYLRAEEARRLIEDCADHLRPIVELALHTGMRRSEVTGLRWDEVDLQQGCIILPGTRTKNSDTRRVPLNREAKRVLTEREKARPAQSEWVFCQPDGRRLGNIRKAFEGACHRAGIKDFRFHDLRHSFCSALVNQGVPLPMIAKLAGHSTESMAARYSHVDEDRLAAAAETAVGFFLPDAVGSRGGLTVVRPPAFEPSKPAESETSQTTAEGQDDPVQMAG